MVAPVDPYAKKRPALADRVQAVQDDRAEKSAEVEQAVAKAATGKRSKLKDEKRVAATKARVASGDLVKPPGMSKGRHRRVPPRCTPEEYAQAWEVYRITPSVIELVKATGWSKQRCLTIIDKGAPDWGMPALKDRYKTYIDANVRDGDQAEADLMHATAKEARGLQLDALGALRQAFTKASVLQKKRKSVSTKELKDLWDIFEKAGRYISFASGGADSRTDLVMPHGILDRNAMLTLLVEAGIDEVIDVPAAVVVPKQISPAPRPEPTWQSVVSTNIKAIRHDEVTGVLEVAFKNSGTYKFAAVPVDAFRAFLTAQSKGKFFAEVIKPRFKQVSA